MGIKNAWKKLIMIENFISRCRDGPVLKYQDQFRIGGGETYEQEAKTKFNFDPTQREFWDKDRAISDALRVLA